MDARRSLLALLAGGALAGCATPAAGPGVPVAIDDETRRVCGDRMYAERMWRGRGPVNRATFDRCVKERTKAVPRTHE